MNNYDDSDIQNLINTVRIGIISSVDIEKVTARVKFEDKGIISGNLKIIQHTPLITVQKKVDGSSWGYKAEYTGFNRKLGLGEIYKTELPDVIENKKTIAYTGEEKLYEEIIKVYPWIPDIGQYVLCVFLPNGDGDGFILGGI